MAANLSWSYEQSPFHAGELAIQTRLGVQERLDRQGRRIIRDYLPDQHRDFFAQLSYVLVGTVASDSQPWASVLVGEPRFITSPDRDTLHIAAQPLFGDPLHTTLTVGADIGLLGIELNTRRRNRLNGTITAIQPEGFTVAVGQSFGNCPQYIQARQFDLRSFDAAVVKSVHTLAMLGDAERVLIAAADTFFIATAYQNAAAGPASGVDVSHRGGKPGFVRIDDAQTLTIPDFSGNLHFNTFGNLELNPRAGLVFIDFAKGDLLYLTGTAEVIWDSPEIMAYEGAERLLRFYVKQGYRVEGSLPLAWSAPEVSPFLNDTGPWRSQA
ncbi:pyridoxamine 5'-phosphate oxidase family protein [Phormidium tenue]|uniref:Pyridoxamine 5'-phosphate oxidase n=1 Tax=Phormidium tenue NIES-30 TaxID=549789 RepID=A0A1U7JBQ8_9CYAN|nr:pyridoxamine 5'-phosphate oxidase family protein [Phormidium tenue]MBD2229975.1 pyridoxamine 5'-phosphate oxidase family protein [Phormidium tenue FACHB-1052]OKH51173.1 pyridoxamine 5'-phosphate oxidase [Phormidium tenue NIES-30]